MTDRTRLTLAATLTALFLGAMSAGGLLSHAHSSPVAAPKSSLAPTAITHASEND